MCGCVRRVIRLASLRRRCWALSSWARSGRITFAAHLVCRLLLEKKKDWEEAPPQIGIEKVQGEGGQKAERAVRSCCRDSKRRAKLGVGTRRHAGHGDGCVD